MMAMIAPAGVRSGMARYAPISPSRSFTPIFRVCTRLTSLNFEKFASIAGENSRTLVVADIEPFDRGNRFGDQAPTLFRIERCIRRKQTARCAEVIVTAARCGRIAIERGVGVEHPKVGTRRFLQLLGAGIAVRRAKEDLPKSECDAASKIRNHAAHVMGDNCLLYTSDAADE